MFNSGGHYAILDDGTIVSDQDVPEWDYRLDAMDDDALNDAQLEYFSQLLWDVVPDDPNVLDWPYCDDMQYWRGLLDALRAYGLPRRVIIQMIGAVLPVVGKNAETNEWVFLSLQERG